METYDVVIIGGAIIGSAIAYFLSQLSQFNGRILVIEKDPSYATASTALSAASIRMQFSNRVNVLMSKFGGEFIQNFDQQYAADPDIADLSFIQNGYLFLAETSEQREILTRNAQTQRAAGAETELLTRAELSGKFAMLSLDDNCLGAWGPRGEGWFDNMGLLNGFRTLAKRAGVTYLQDEVIALSLAKNRVSTAHLASGAQVSGVDFVNAAGPRAGQIARMAGIDLPVEARKRTTFLFQAQTPPPSDMPLVVDHSGVYFRPEGQMWICAMHPVDDPEVDHDDFQPRYQEFDDIIWPKLAARSKQFEAIKLRRMWAGHYAYNTLDQNAIIGRHPTVANMILANGFSGHGLQQAPAVGRAVSELICFNQFRSLDLGDLSFERVVNCRPFFEYNIV
ncbi:MAG: FAD-binding oxidoreductase [Alphaproteobacteria bacterium]|nr:FAD-binding oxidoreductase [Alphaproteobacteria bacterium]